MRPTASILRQSTAASAASSSRSFSRQAVAKALSVAASSTPKPRRSYASAASPIHTGSLVKTSTLPNGVRVATESTPGHFSAVGVYVDAGSRFERPWVAGESGVSHLLDRMAFKSTSNRSSEQMTSEIEKLGGQVMCSSSRETIMYQSSMFNQDLPAVLSILADTIQHPLILPEELQMQREAAAYEIGEIWNKPEMILPELLHMTAYKDNTLGNPLLCPMESLENMTVENLQTFIKTWYKPERIVVAGAGMQHEMLVEMSEDLFGKAKAAETVLDSPSASASSASSSPRSSRSSSSSSLWSSPFSTTAKSSASHAEPSLSEIASAKARYTGGELYLPRDDLPFTHVYVAFEGVSIHDDDIYALAVLQILLGGGSSFSAGGPGKGMYSRLYNVLNTQHSVDYIASFLHSYNDSALFGIAAACDPKFNPMIASVIAQQLELCTGLGGGRNTLSGSGGVTRAELSRARNQLKSSLMMALESRLVEVEDLGRQVQVHGTKVSVEEMCEKIDRVDLEVLQRVAKRILRPQQNGGQQLNHGLGSGQTTVVAQGKLEGLGDVRELLFMRELGAKPTLA